MDLILYSEHKKIEITKQMSLSAINFLNKSIFSNHSFLGLIPGY